MSSLRDEDLVLYYYGESRDAIEIEEQLESSATARRRYADLCVVLDAVQEESVPDRSPAYGSRVWHRIAPQILDGSARGWMWRRWLPRRQWALAAVMVLLLVVAFLAGRTVPGPDARQLAGLSSDGRDRILLMTVAGHLERSEMLLLELVNTRDNGEVDLSVERRLAGELGQESRLYRQAAQQAGKSDVVAILEQLETVLVELSNGPETVPSQDLGQLRLRLDEGDVLFKVRVVGSRLRREVDTPSRSTETVPDVRDL